MIFYFTKNKINMFHQTAFKICKLFFTVFYFTIYCYCSKVKIHYFINLCQQSIAEDLSEVYFL